MSGGTLLYDLQHNFLWKTGEIRGLCDTLHVLGHEGDTSSPDIPWNERKVHYQGQVNYQGQINYQG